jgi:predicted ATPase
MADRTAKRPTFLRTVSLRPGQRPDGHPFDVPAIASLDEIAFAPVTVFVGDNGTGKSTLIEAIAIATGFNAEGGDRSLRFETHGTHSALHTHLDVRFGRRPANGWFLRAETFYGMATRIARDDDPKYGIAEDFPDLHRRSHGESFLDLLEQRLERIGLFVMDEPESALSFIGQLQLVALIADAVAAGSQFVIATHSPLLMAYPGARILSFDDGTVREAAYDDLPVVTLWRRFLADPPHFLTALLDADP